MTKTVGNKQGRTQTMKKIFLAIATLAVAFGFTACSNEDEVIENEQNNNEFITAFTEPGTTRTALDGNDTEGYDVVWSEGDQFSAYTYNLSISSYNFSGYYKLVSDPGSTKGTFQKDKGKDLDGVAYIAYYPNGYMGVNWPTTQTYTEGNITGFPMKAIHEAGSSTLKFTNEGGILRLAVKGSAKVKSITVSAQGLSAPITLDCGDGVTLTTEGKLFHIAMPTGTFKGVEIALTDTEGKTCTKKFKGTDGLVVERSKITKASFTASDFKSAVTYNVGDLVTLDSHEGIVVDIDGTLVAVATMNVGATVANGPGCLGEKLNYDAACSAWSGWRLPTVDEFKTLCDIDYPTLGDTMEGEGIGALLWYIDDKDGIDLYLPLNDCDDQNPYDKYWTGTPGENDTEKCFYFAPELDWESGGWVPYDYTPVPYEWRGKDGVLPYKEEAAKTDTYLVRLFHDLP